MNGRRESYGGFSIGLITTITFVSGNRPGFMNCPECGLCSLGIFVPGVYVCVSHSPAAASAPPVRCPGCQRTSAAWFICHVRACILTGRTIHCVVAPRLASTAVTQLQRSMYPGRGLSADASAALGQLPGRSRHCPTPCILGSG